MNPLPRITIITPSFNQAQFLERTIQSVLDQEYPNLEYFIIDGGSTDGSVEIIRRYEHRLAGWVSQRDNGQTDALNRGLERATGEIIAFLNSDDVHTPGTLHQVAQLMSGDNAPRWLVGACLMIDAQDRLLDRFHHHAPKSFAAYLMHTSGMIPQPSSFWHKSLFERHGKFDLGLHYCFDYEFNCRLLAGGETPVLIDQTLAAFRHHAQSKGGSTPIRFGLERLVVAKRYLSDLPWSQRWPLWRNIGYRRRLYAIEQAKVDRPLRLYSNVLCRPWWLASGDIRAALWQFLTHRRQAV